MQAESPSRFRAQLLLSGRYTQNPLGSQKRRGGSGRNGIRCSCRVQVLGPRSDLAVGAERLEAVPLLARVVGDDRNTVRQRWSRDFTLRVLFHVGAGMQRAR